MFFSLVNHKKTSIDGVCTMVLPADQPGMYHVLA